MPHWSMLGAFDILFTHVDEHTGKNTVFHVTGLLDDPKYKKLPATNVNVDHKFAALLPDLRGLEPHRLNRLWGVPTAAFEPLPFVEMPDGTHLMVDGSHRYYVAHRRGEDWVPAKLVKPKLWRKYIVTGFPEQTAEALQRSYSGLA